MKSSTKLSLVLIMLSLFVFNVSAQTPSSTPGESAEQAELSRLSKEMLTAFRSANYDKTIATGQQILTLDTKINGPDGKVSADVYFYTGASYNEKKKYAQAIDNLQRSLAIYLKKYPSEKSEMLSIYNLMGLIGFRQNENKKAQSWLAQAVKISEELYGNESEKTLEYVGNLSTIYRNLGDNVQAEVYMKQARDIAAKVFGKDTSSFYKYDDAYVCFVNNTADEKLQKVLKQRSDDKAESGENGTGKVISGKMRSLAEPKHVLASDKYPARVIVRVMIDESGNVVQARPLCGDRRYADASVEAALQSKFFPTTVDGKPIKVPGLIIYNYNTGSGIIYTGLVNLWER